MASIIGEWKTAAMITFSEESNEIIYGDRAYFEAQGDEEALQMFTVITRICEDGSITSLMPLPEGFTPEMVKEEGMEMLDGMVIIDTSDWKEEDGKFWINSGEQREVCGEEVSPYDEMVLEGNILTLPSLKLERI